jgi:DNA repair protein RadC
MTQFSLFGMLEKEQTRKIIFRSIEARYSKTVVREDAPEWVASTRYTSPKQVYEAFLDLQHEIKEHFIALHLDGKNRILCMDRVSIGSLNQSIVHPRELFKTAVLSSAAAIILIHNHPTGDPTPSQEDISITRRLVEAGELLGIRVLEHIVIGSHGEYVSFVERGLM